MIKLGIVAFLTVGAGLAGLSAEEIGLVGGMAAMWARLEHRLTKIEAKLKI